MGSLQDHPAPAEDFIRKFQDLAADASFQALYHISVENSRLREENGNLDIANQQNLKEWSRLRRRLEAKDTDAAKINSELQDLTRDKEELQRSLAEANKAVGDKAKQLTEESDRATRLEADLKAKEAHIDTLTEALNNEKSSGIALVNAKKEMQIKLESSNRVVEAQKAKIDRIDQFIFKLQKTDKDAVRNELRSIFKSVYDVVEGFLGSSLDKQALIDGRWERIREHDSIKRLIPVLPSNSPVAKQMRVAAVLGICANALADNIFHPTYLFQDEDLSGIMSNLANEDPVREAFLRSVLLRIGPRYQKLNGELRVDACVKEVYDCVEPVTPAQKRDEFQGALGKAFTEVCQRWMRIQELQDHIEPIFELEDTDEWLRLQAPPPSPPSSNPGPAPAKPKTADDSRPATNGVGKPRPSKVDKQDIRFIVWPAFYVPHKGSKQFLQGGYVLCDAQVKAAKSEEDAAPLQGTCRAARQSHRKVRTLSVSQTNGGDAAAGTHGRAFLPANGVGSNGA